MKLKPRRHESFNEGKSIRITSAAGSKAALEFRAVTQSVNEAVVMTDSRGRILFWNEGAERIFGYAEKDILGQPLAPLIPLRLGTRPERRVRHIPFHRAAPLDKGSLNRNRARTAGSNAGRRSE